MADEQSVDSLYLSCRAHLARVISRLVPPHEVEDVVQETYVRVCQFRSRGIIHHPRALMATIARNLALDRLKSADHRLTTTVDDHDAWEFADPNPRADPLARAMADQEFAQLCEAVRQLPVQCRRAFVLRKVYGYSQREIAGQMELSENTVEKHIARGMKLCTEYMLANAKPARPAASGQHKTPREGRP